MDGPTIQIYGLYFFRKMDYERKGPREKKREREEKKILLKKKKEFSRIRKQGKKIKEKINKKLFIWLMTVADDDRWLLSNY